MDPEFYHQERQITFDRFGIRKGGGNFGEFDGGNPMAIYRPSGGAYRRRTRHAE